MTHNVHALTVDALRRAVSNLGNVMDKAASHAKSQEIPIENLLQARLFPDMYNLLQQLQYCCYLAVDLAKHFADGDPPHVGYDEENWEQLRKSVDTTASWLAGISAARVEKDAAKMVPLFYDDKQGLPAIDYAARQAVPNFYFHMVVAYAILRHNGVPLGKGDFLGDIGAKPMP